MNQSRTCRSGSLVAAPTKLGKNGLAITHHGRLLAGTPALRAECDAIASTVTVPNSVWMIRVRRSRWRLNLEAGRTDAGAVRVLLHLGLAAEALQIGQQLLRLLKGQPDLRRSNRRTRRSKRATSMVSTSPLDRESGRPVTHVSAAT